MKKERWNVGITHYKNDKGVKLTVKLAEEPDSRKMELLTAYLGRLTGDDGSTERNALIIKTRYDSLSDRDTARKLGISYNLVRKVILSHEAFAGTKFPTHHAPPAEDKDRLYLRRKMIENGITQSEIARQLGVCRERIRQVVTPNTNHASTHITQATLQRVEEAIRETIHRKSPFFTQVST